MSLLVSLLVWLPAVNAWAAEPLRIRVLSYNIHHGEGLDSKLDLPRIAGVIRSVSPNLVALQEVDRKTARAQRVDQPTELARLLKMEVVFEKNLPFQGGQYGNAILSNLPIIRHENTHLPSLNNGEQRGVLRCTLQPAAPHPSIQFFCTHFDHRPPDRERLASAKRVNELIAAQSGRPAILAGDLNARRDSAVLTTLARQWQLADDQEQPTQPSAAPRHQIDFILFHPQNRWKTVESRVLDEEVASDHRAIFAVLELLPETPDE